MKTKILVTRKISDGAEDKLKKEFDVDLNLKDEPIPTGELIKMGNDYELNQNPKQQIDVDKFLEEFGPELGDLYGIWVTGGEPFIDDSVFDFFDKLKKYVDPAQVKLLITTNASKLDVSRLSELRDYLRTQIHVSIDATGDLYSYMRGYNFTWDQVNDKIQQLAEWKKGGKHTFHQTLSLNGTYQLHNLSLIHI